MTKFIDLLLSILIDKGSKKYVLLENASEEVKKLNDSVEKYENLLNESNKLNSKLQKELDIKSAKLEAIKDLLAKSNTGK